MTYMIQLPEISSPWGWVALVVMTLFFARILWEELK